MSDIANRYENIMEKMADAIARSNRSPEDVALLAVSKRQPIERIKAYLDVADAKNDTVRLGENYVQEWVEKQPELRAHSSISFRSHLIGPLQSNKAKLAVQHFDLIESVHTEKLARELNKQAAKITKVQDIFLQINISDDPAKSGFSPEEVEVFLPELLKQLSALRLCGLMTITKLYDDPEDARPDFRALRLLREKLLQHPSLSSLELSMGMSADFDVAIEEGATLVRVGSALFGARA